MPPRVKITDKDHGWKKLFETVKELSEGGRVKVGVLSDDAKGGLHVEGGKLTVAEIAVVQEFGTADGKIPSRSFVRSTFDEQRENLKKLGAKLFAGILFGKLKMTQALGIMGSTLAADIKKKITEGDGIPPPNAPSTIAAKGSDRTLVDTARMLNAITYAVDDGKSEE